MLLYIGEYCGKLVHVKYQFSDVYKTIDGRWAAPYQAWDYKRSGDSVTVQPERIVFANPLEYNIKNASKELVEQAYPAPYYEIRGDKAVAIYGNYVEDLFELKKQTVLKSYNFF